ncbi:hypothetical protein DBV15_10974 [Temnothorax longispinosus]|uniref:Uncharacterized protein n=1 Tax=Temnothorax longispinosus TaxID=300112 RepID=A0A4S2L1R9_9HYME|nr:hypothetical protein DBV15_10974 [Temnothorax longispinosus]
MPTKDAEGRRRLGLASGDGGATVERNRVFNSADGGDGCDDSRNVFRRDGASAIPPRRDATLRECGPALLNHGDIPPCRSIFQKRIVRHGLCLRASAIGGFPPSYRRIVVDGMHNSACCTRNARARLNLAKWVIVTLRVILPKRISLCEQTFKICGRQYELNLPEGSSAEIVAKKNSKSHSLRRVMELKDLEFGTRGWIGSRRRRCPGLNPWITESRTYYSRNGSLNVGRTIKRAVKAAKSSVKEKEKDNIAERPKGREYSEFLECLHLSTPVLNWAPYERCGEIE